MACTEEDCQITESGLEIYRAWRKGWEPLSRSELGFGVGCKNVGVTVGHRWVSGELRLSKGCSCIGQPVGEMRSSPLYPYAWMREVHNLRGKLNSSCHGWQMPGGRAVVEIL